MASAVSNMRERCNNSLFSSFWPFLFIYFFLQSVLITVKSQQQFWIYTVLKLLCTANHLELLSFLLLFKNYYYCLSSGSSAIFEASEGDWSGRNVASSKTSLTAIFWDLYYLLTVTRVFHYLLSLVLHIFSKLYRYLPFFFFFLHSLELYFNSFGIQYFVSF